jgi:hypothetical protein
MRFSVESIAMAGVDNVRATKRLTLGSLARGKSTALMIDWELSREVPQCDRRDSNLGRGATDS